MSNKNSNQHYQVAALIGYLWSEDENIHNRENKINIINIYEAIKYIYINKKNIFICENEFFNKTETLNKLNEVFYRKQHSRSSETLFHNKIISKQTEKKINVNSIENDILKLSIEKIKNGYLINREFNAENLLVIKKFVAMQIARNPLCYSHYIDQWLLDKSTYYKENEKDMFDMSCFNLLSIAHFENVVTFLNNEVIKNFKKKLNQLNYYNVDIIELSKPGFLTDCTVFLDLHDEFKNLNNKTYFLPINNNYTMVLYHKDKLNIIQDIKEEYNVSFEINALSNSRVLAYFKEKNTIINNISNYLIYLYEHNGMEVFFKRYFEINTKIINIEHMFKEYIDIKEAGLIFDYKRTRSIIY